VLLKKAKKKSSSQGFAAVALVPSSAKVHPSGPPVEDEEEEAKSNTEEAKALREALMQGPEYREGVARGSHAGTGVLYPIVQCHSARHHC